MDALNLVEVWPMIWLVAVGCAAAVALLAVGVVIGRAAARRERRRGGLVELDTLAMRHALRTLDDESRAPSRGVS